MLICVFSFTHRESASHVFQSFLEEGAAWRYFLKSKIRPETDVAELMKAFLI